ncbi:MAG: hypothetical protein IT379_23615 [Deltaproteobacteria bacterium]|nr:hypothetical protein [Deltaproteobacteria bacterium]
MATTGLYFEVSFPQDAQDELIAFVKALAADLEAGRISEAEAGELFSNEFDRIRDRLVVTPR